MLKKHKCYVAITLLVVTLWGCTYVESDVLPVSGDEAALLDNRFCRTFGFRNWSLWRGDDSITLSAEASLPTPAWSVVLHQAANMEYGAIVLIIETVEPLGLSSSVVSWVNFETIVKTNSSTESDITVKCAGDVIWTS